MPPKKGDKEAASLSLPHAEIGKVVTRFPPEPSGYLHIGHAKAALLNNYFARKYEGKLIVRFDDTNPSKEKLEFEESIIEDLELLGVRADIRSRTSDFFPVLQDMMRKFIVEGNAYVDKTPSDQMRIERGKGIESADRNNSVEENLRLWEEMLEGSAEGVTCCVRAKMDMKSKNKCMRDPVFYRCNVEIPHHATGTKYKAYPIYDFACPIVDSLEGVTHAMRTNEYADRIPQYEWVIKMAGLRPVIVHEFSRLNFVNTVLSKRKLQWIVDSGHVEGWEDPRFPTVRGIVRRGLKVQALMEFILEQGPSKNVNLMEWGALWNKNKIHVDPVAPRFMCVAKDAAVRVTLEGAPTTPECTERQLHPKDEKLGTAPQYVYREILLEQDDSKPRTDGEEVTLMRWGNAILDTVNRSGDTVLSIEGRLHLEGDFKKTKAKLHWVPLCSDSDLTATSSEPPTAMTLTQVVLREFDHLIIKKKPEEADEMADLVNTNSVFDTNALADPQLRMLKRGDVMQLERRGFFIVDQAYEDPTAPMILLKIPDGKTKAMSAVSVKVDAERLSKGQ